MKSSKYTAALLDSRGVKDRSYHLVGIGGTGMSALAEALADAGCSVTGSDRFLDARERVASLDALAARGVPLFPQDGSGVHAGLTAVVVSTAIESDNPDVVAARANGVAVVHRATALAELLAAPGAKLIAVAGTSGKSTTTAMLGHFLDCAGFAPTVVNGAACPAWAAEDRTGSVLHGDGGWRVAEVDESDRSLLAFSPYAAIILNASADHFDLAETNALFDAFAARVTGPLIDARSPDVNLPCDDEIEEGAWSVSFPFHGRRFTLPMPGKHNATDAFLACELAFRLGANETALENAVATFGGISRRLETVGIRKDGVRVVDDYAHNTEKLRASIATLRERSKRLVALWRPHGYAPLRKMRADLTEMFAKELRKDDRLVLLPVFDAGGTAVRDVSSEDFAEDLEDAGVTVDCVADIESARKFMAALATPGDILATFGARDPALPRLARALANQEQ